MRADGHILDRYKSVCNFTIFQIPAWPLLLTKLVLDWNLANIAFAQIGPPSFICSTLGLIANAFIGKLSKENSICFVVKSSG